MELKDRVAVVSGGASGLGRAAALELADHGCRVAVLDLNGQGAASVSAQMMNGSVAVETDVADAESVDSAIGTVVETFGRIDICVNAAGRLSAGKIVARGKALDLDVFRASIEVNLVGAFDVMRQCAGTMASNEPDEDGERGVIINVSSIAASQGQAGQVPYSAAKAGLIGLTLPAARDLASLGIRVITITPGTFDTPMAASVPEKVKEALLELVLHPSRMGEPAEFAALVRHVIENRYLNATTLAIDAGIRVT